jgi:hypothetical protein
MRLTHRHTLFPLAIISLTLALVGFMLYTVTADKEVETQVTQEQVVQVNDGQYQEEMAKVLNRFDARLSEADDDLAKLLGAETAQAALLSIRVPAQYKELHLNFVLTLTEIQFALKSDDRDISEQVEKIEELKSEHTWLAK